MLPAIEIETGPKPTATVIWLHGLGDDGNGWSQVVPSLGLPSRLAIRFLFPHAPTMPVSINNGYVMRAWYDIREANLNERADLDGVRRSQAAVEAMIAHEKARGIAASRIVLAGFSQGGAVALYAGLRHRERLAGIVALSTYLIDAPALAAEAAPANRDVPIFMAHGTLDPGRAHRVGRAVAAGARRGGLARRMERLSDGALGGARGNRRRQRVPAAGACALTTGRRARAPASRAPGGSTAAALPRRRSSRCRRFIIGW